MGDLRVIFAARDYDATVSFFRDVMGIPLVEEFEDGGGCILAAGTGRIEVLRPDDGTPEPVSGVMLAWEVADADAEHERLSTAGAEILFGPEDQPWGHRNFGVRGPDGWEITLFQVVAPH
jgi:catechol 2,3-dioxygenase-like lactoylglutathione lyase family enzyme